MIYVIHRTKIALFISALFVATPLLANTASTNTTSTNTAVKQTPPYGDNPNIFKVLGYKAKEKLTNTATRIDNAAQRGVEKVKPKVEQTVETTKDFTEETANKAVTGIERTANKAKEVVMGNPNDNAPIVQRSLSESSSNVDLAPEALPTPTTTPIPTFSPTPPVVEVNPPSTLTNSAAEPVNAVPTTQAEDDDSSIPR